jgi:transcriptional regulator with XRE-family HTH domain
LGIRIGMDINSASSRMNHYEKGRHPPDIKTLKKISEELNVPLAYLFCESDIIAELNCLMHQLPIEEKKSYLKRLALMQKHLINNKMRI